MNFAIGKFYIFVEQLATFKSDRKEESDRIFAILSA